MGDHITGGLGADWLTGGEGADAFRFNEASEGRDRITGFSNVEWDRIEISAEGFGGNLVDCGTVDVIATSAPYNEFHTGSDGYFLFAADSAGGELLWMQPAATPAMLSQSHFWIT